jgi:hypothetical protein
MRQAFTCSVCGKEFVRHFCRVMECWPCQLERRQPKKGRSAKAPKARKVLDNFNRDMQIVAARKEGKTLREIGQEHGVSKQRIHQIIKNQEKMDLMWL